MKYIFKKKYYILLATILDFLGNFIFKIFKPKKTTHSANPKSILLIRLDHMGDVILSLGIPKELKAHHPQAKIIFLTSSLGADLLQNNPFVDEVIVYDAPYFIRNYQPNTRSSSYWQLARRLAKEKFDWGISLRGDARENFLLYLIGAKERIGYAITGGEFLLTKNITYHPKIHQLERHVRLLDSLGIKVKSLESKVYLTDKERAATKAKWLDWGLGENKKYIGFAFAAGAQSKNWPIQNLEVFLGELNHRFADYTVVLVGSLGQRQEDLRLLSHLKYVNLLGKTSLRELCALLESFKVFIGQDSGPTHLAAMVGVPTIFLFSGTNDFQEWKPLAENTRTLYNKVECSPCHQNQCDVPGHPCMSGIKPGDVIKILESLLR